MLEVQLYALGSVVIVSLISLIGVFALSLNDRFLKHCIFLLVSLAVGALFGDALIHLFPETIEEIGAPHAAFYVLVGIMLFLVLEKFLHWRHSHGEEDLHEVPEGEQHEHHIRPLGFLVITSDGLHNLIDGLIIGASYLVSVEVGIATTLAIILHEIPQEIGDFGLLLHAGFSKMKALFVNFLSALTAVVGVIIALLLGTRIESFTPALLALAAGAFIYIAGSDLVPEIQKTKGLGRSSAQLIAILFGIALMFALLLLEV